MPRRIQRSEQQKRLTRTEILEVLLQEGVLSGDPTRSQGDTRQYFRDRRWLTAEIQQSMHEHAETVTAKGLPPLLKQLYPTKSDREREALAEEWRRVITNIPSAKDAQIGRLAR